MKTIDYYMNLTYRLEIIPDLTEGGYAAGYPDLPGCITVGETLESVAKNAGDAKKAWLEAIRTATATEPAVFHGAQPTYAPIQIAVPTMPNLRASSPTARRPMASLGCTSVVSVGIV